MKSYVYINYCLGLYVFDGKKFISFTGFQSVFASGLMTLTFKSMSRLTDFSSRENQSVKEDLDLKWKEFDMICTEKSVFPSITTQLITLFL